MMQDVWAREAKGIRLNLTFPNPHLPTSPWLEHILCLYEYPHSSLQGLLPT